MSTPCYADTERSIRATIASVAKQEGNQGAAITAAPFLFCRFLGTRPETLPELAVPEPVEGSAKECEARHFDKLNERAFDARGAVVCVRRRRVTWDSHTRPHQPSATARLPAPSSPRCKVAVRVPECSPRAWYRSSGRPLHDRTRRHAGRLE